MCECVRVEVHLVHLLLEGRGGEQGEVESRRIQYKILLQYYSITVIQCEHP